MNDGMQLSETRERTCVGKAHLSHFVGGFRRRHCDQYVVRHETDTLGRTCLVPNTRQFKRVGLLKFMIPQFVQILVLFPESDCPLDLVIREGSITAEARQGDEYHCSKKFHVGTTSVASDHLTITINVSSLPRPLGKH